MTELAVATAADAPRITELLNEISCAHYGEADLTEAEVTSWFGFEKLEVLLAERKGEIAVAYGDRFIASLFEAQELTAKVRIIPRPT